MPFTTGARLGPYEILGPIGAGGMGEVYRARDTRLSRIVAIKMLPADKLADEGRKRRFLQEARAASALNHPNIVTIHDILSEGSAEFIVMEFVDGQTLGRLIPKGGMRIDAVLRYAIQIAGALAAAHAAGIIHRDLKPGNIMVTADGRIKLLDFGLAKLHEPANSHEDESTRTLGPQSDEGAIVGTAAYMSPEQAEGKPVDARADIFSFGAVLYEMVTGSRAFHGDSNLSTLSAILRENPKPVSQVVTDVPRELERIISRCLRKDPARRFQAMPDLKVALEELKEESDSGTAEAGGSRAAPRTAISRRNALLFAAPALLLAMAAAGWALFRPASKPLPPLRSVPLTAYVGREMQPTFSPDGSQVAFVWDGEKQDNADIYVKLVDGGAPLRLTSTPGWHAGPAWSPDGRQIAYLRNGGVYSVSPLGGPERKLLDGDSGGVAWLSDGQRLLVSFAKDADDLHSIFLFSPATGEMRKITAPPPASNPGDGDYSPAVSPDGQRIAFMRQSGSSGELWVQPLVGGSAKRLTSSGVEFMGVVWVDNSEVVFERGAFGALSLWRMKVDGQAAPQSVAGVLDGASDPAIVHPGNRPARFAYARTVFDGNIWRMEIASDGNGRFRTVAPPVPVIASTRMDMSAEFSPDGKRIVVGSDRDGFREIWASAADGSGAVQLTYLKSQRSGSPKWSPDGRQVVFDSLAAGSNDIWVVGSEGGTPNRVTTEPSNDARPSWSRDGRWIYFRSDRSGSQQIWRVPAVPPYKPAVQITREGGFEAVESLDGKLLYYAQSGGSPGAGVWSVPPEGGKETQVLPGARAGYWAVGGAGIYYVDMAHYTPDGAPFLFFDVLTGKTAQAAVLPKIIVGAAPVVTVTHDGRFVAWTRADNVDTDLMLIDGFR